MSKIIPAILAVTLAAFFASGPVNAATATGVTFASTGIKSEHIDFVLLRMIHLSVQAPADIANLRILLQKELAASSMYKAAWDEGTQIFKARKSNLVNPGFQNIPEEYHIALIAYTLHNTPSPSNAFYSDFNKQTRELCSGLTIQDTYPYKSFFKLLILAIDALSKDPKFQNVKPYYYRGASIRFSYSEGQEVAFQHFASTTIDLKKAVEYARNTTMYEFEGPLPHSIYLYHHSGFPDEQEILVSPMVTYKVKKIDFGFGSPYTKHTLVATTNPTTLIKL